MQKKKFRKQMSKVTPKTAHKMLKLFEAETILLFILLQSYKVAHLAKLSRP